jgi:WD40 repeat protein
MPLYAQTINVTKEFHFKANPQGNSINSVAFKSDGSKIVSGTNCHPASIRIFDANSGTLTWDYEVGSAFMCIMGVGFSKNSHYLLAIEEMGNILVFDNTGNNPVLIDTVKTLTSYAFSIEIAPNNTSFVAGCSGGRMKIYELPSGNMLYNIPAHTGWVTAVAYSPNGNYIVSGGSDDKVKIWSNTGTLLFTCNGHTGDITSVKVTPDNQYVVSASKDDKMMIWNISTGTLVRTITGHKRDINGIDISPDGTKVVSASSDSTCKIWELNTGNEILTFSVKDSGAVNTVAWSPDGQKIVTGNVKSDLVVWKVNSSSSILDEIKRNEFRFSLYPNPAEHEFNLLLPNELNKHYKVQVINPQGKVVFEAMNLNRIPLANITSGIYYVYVSTPDKVSLPQLLVKS